jgi:hypothetical protein
MAPDIRGNRNINPPVDTLPATRSKLVEDYHLATRCQNLQHHQALKMPPSDKTVSLFDF